MIRADMHLEDLADVTVDTLARDLRAAANEWATEAEPESGARVASFLRGAADDLEHLDEVKRFVVALCDSAKKACDATPMLQRATWISLAVAMLGERVESIRMGLPGFPQRCEACSIEAEIGTEENPHPVPGRFHRCRP